MKNKHRIQWKFLAQKRIAKVLLALVFIGTVPQTARASAWDPTLLVNTESFQVIDDGSGSTNIELRFGDTANEILRWDVTNGRFQFTDDVHVEGNITGSGTLKVDGTITTEADLTLNQDADTNNVTLTFGSDTTNETATWLNAADRFEFSDDLATTGNLTASGTFKVTGAATFGSTVQLKGVTYTFPYSDGSASGKVLKTNAAGQLSWSSDNDSGTSSISYAEAASYFVNDTGDTMTGGLLIQNGGTPGAISAGLLLEVAGVASGAYLHAENEVTSSGAIRADGNLSLNDDQTTADAVLTFGQPTTNETLTFTNSTGQFDFSDDVDTTGNITADGNFTINNDNGAANAVLTFGNDAGAETVTFSDTSNNFELSDDLDITGTANTTGNITTDADLTINEDNGAADAVLTFGSDGSVETLKFLNNADRFEVSDDFAATGNITASGTLKVDGTITSESDLTLNQDADTNDVTLTFGSDTTNETAKWLNAADRFEFSDDLATTGNLTASGTFKVTGAATLGSTLTINNQTYTFPGGAGASGYILKTNGAGTLQWAPDAGPGSGDILFLQPEYTHAIYFASGSSTVGTLALSGSIYSGEQENYYLWKTTKATKQDYWISTRLRVPDNFSRWDPVKPIRIRYRTSSDVTATNHLQVRMFDTAGTQLTNLSTGSLVSTSWKTQPIRGPESTGTWTPGGFFTVLVRLATTTSGTAAASFLEMNWETKAP